MKDFKYVFLAFFGAGAGHFVCRRTDLVLFNNGFSNSNGQVQTLPSSNIKPRIEIKSRTRNKIGVLKIDLKKKCSRFTS